MMYGSVCSGIEAATAAWHPLGWSPAFFSEIEKFPSAVLAHHYGSNMPSDTPTGNGVPNHGDMTKFQEWPDHAIDLLVGGTPCQSFSVAGLRKGLDDPRGNLMLVYAAIAQRYRPRWMVWENVPGVISSDRGRDFASLLAILSGRRIEVPASGWRNAGCVPHGEGAYGLAWRVLDAQFVRVDGYGRAVPQRRRRVFVVGYFGDWRRAAAVLFERQSLSRDTAPRREARQGVPPTISARPTGGGGLGTDFDLDGGLIAADCAPTLDAHFGEKMGLENQHINQGGGFSLPPVAKSLNAHGARLDSETETLLPMTGGGFDVAYALREVAPALTSNYGKQPDSSDTGQGPMILPIAIQERAVSENMDAGPGGSGISTDGVAYTLEARNNVQAVAFNAKAGGSPTIGKSYLDDGTSYTLDCDGLSTAVAFDMRGRDGGAMPEGPHDTANIRASSGGSSRSYVAEQWAVRRLTPTECHRLQGFPDDYCNIPWRGKDFAPDGPQYKALGNSMAVNVMRWIGRRIEMVEELTDKAECLQCKDAAE